MESVSPLERLRRELALAVGENAVFDGWTRRAVDSAAGQLGIDPVQARLAMPKTQAGMINVYIQEVDRALEAWFTPKRLKPMKIREKIRALVWHRLEIMGPAREAVRRALAILAMPQNVPLALRTGWRSADLMWRIAGDTSTDFNSLHQADDARRRLRLDVARLARRSKRGLDRHRRLPRPTHRRRHALREVQGRVARFVRALEPVAVSWSTPLSPSLSAA